MKQIVLALILIFPSIGIIILEINNMYLTNKNAELKQQLEQEKNINKTYTQVYGHHIKTGLYNAKGREVL